VISNKRRFEERKSKRNGIGLDGIMEMMMEMDSMEIDWGDLRLRLRLKFSVIKLHR
jgi:hypothetical protein